MTDETVFLVALHSVVGMGHQPLHRLIDRYGTAERAVTQSADEVLRSIPGLTAEARRGVLACRERVPWAERVAAQLTRLGVSVILLGQSGYPDRLRQLSSPPHILYVIGDPSILNGVTASIVGSTNPSRKGQELASEMARRLARSGCTVVSGMAKGIDLAAHRGAIEAGGRTAFVLPTGILRFKPGGDLPPARTWMDKAVVVSECPPEAEWSSNAAVARNRLIAALGSALVVVETKAKGGAMYTFRDAQELGRSIFVVKYEKPPPSASGNNFAIAQGGLPLSRLADAQDVIAAVGGTASLP
jgi:DNA processing protein